MEDRPCMQGHSKETAIYKPRREPLKVALLLTPRLSASRAVGKEHLLLKPPSLWRSAMVTHAKWSTGSEKQSDVWIRCFMSYTRSTQQKSGQV